MKYFFVCMLNGLVFIFSKNNSHESMRCSMHFLRILHLYNYNEIRFPLHFIDSNYRYYSIPFHMFCLYVYRSHSRHTVDACISVNNSRKLIVMKCNINTLRIKYQILSGFCFYSFFFIWFRLIQYSLVMSAHKRNGMLVKLKQN